MIGTTSPSAHRVRRSQLAPLDIYISARGPREGKKSNLLVCTPCGTLARLLGLYIYIRDWLSFMYYDDMHDAAFPSNTRRSVEACSSISCACARVLPAAKEVRAGSSAEAISDINANHCRRGIFISIPLSTALFSISWVLKVFCLVSNFCSRCFLCAEKCIPRVRCAQAPLQRIISSNNKFCAWLFYPFFRTETMRSF